MRIGRRIITSAAVAVLVTAGAGTAIAAFPDTDVKTYTGCLTAGGVVNYVKEGPAPAQPCSSSKQVVKLSGGDVTKVVATGALTGGGDNGAVTIGLDAAKTVPTGCTSGEVPKWNGSGWGCATDQDTTYAPGTGLALSGVTFSVAPGYRLPQGCATGEVPKRGVGSWLCGSVPVDNSVLQATQTRFTDGDGLPDGGGAVTIASLTVPEGNYLVVAKAMIEAEEDDVGFAAANGVGCSLYSGATAVDSTAWTQSDSNDGEGPSNTPLSLFAAGNGPTTFTLKCSAASDNDLVSAKFGKIVALRVA